MHTFAAFVFIVRKTLAIAKFIVDFFAGVCMYCIRYGSKWFVAFFHIHISLKITDYKISSFFFILLLFCAVKQWNYFFLALGNTKNAETTKSTSHHVIWNMQKTRKKNKSKTKWRTSKEECPYFIHLRNVCLTRFDCLKFCGKCCYFNFIWLANCNFEFKLIWLHRGIKVLHVVSLRHLFCSVADFVLKNECSLLCSRKKRRTRRKKKQSICLIGSATQFKMKLIRFARSHHFGFYIYILR